MNETIYTTPVTPFPNRPADESVYSYPHKYRIESRVMHMGFEQRHIWMWNDGREDVQDWIPTPFDPRKESNMKEVPR